MRYNVENDFYGGLQMANYCITFSPTGGTNRVADILCGALHSQWTRVDLLEEVTLNTADTDVCLVAVPSFGGRVPDLAAQRLKGITGSAKAILVCVYGNRAYEDTLVELQDILTAQGLRPVAAVAAIAEHSIMHAYAVGRPDVSDARELANIAGHIAAKLRKKNTELNLPGNRPYKDYKVAPMIPQTGEHCIGCGRCARRCPTGAISVGDMAVTDNAKCICCMACTAACPIDARKPDPNVVNFLVQRIGFMLTSRKKIEFYV